MKAVKIIAILALLYAGIVFTFESLLGYFQPKNQSTLIITTVTPDGVEKDRVLARIENNQQLYVAANHWPRAWYRQVLEQPNVSVSFNGEKKTYSAVPVTGAEHDQVNNARPLVLWFRILTGFPPRYFVRLDPR